MLELSYSLILINHSFQKVLTIIFKLEVKQKERWTLMSVLAACWYHEENDETQNCISAHLKFASSCCSYSKPQLKLLAKLPREIKVLLRA